MSKKIKVIAAFLLPIIFALSVGVFILPALPKESQILDKDISPIVLSLWHVETFEGGVGSRVQWLNSFARRFESKHEGIFMSVQKMSYDQLCSRLASGQTFDLISFGRGVGEKILGAIQPYDGVVNGYENLLRGGVLDGKQYAVPFLAGGYLLAATKSNLSNVSDFSDLKKDAFNCGFSKKVGKNTIKMASVACGFAQFNSPLSALALSTQSVASDDSALFVDREVTQYGAYESFLNNKTATILLGTQRDFCRLDARQQSGRLGEVVYEPLDGFSDLIQYFSIGKTTDKSRAEYCEKFVEYITGQAAQTTVSQIGMLPVVHCQAYADGVLKQMADCVDKFVVANAFAFSATLEELREASKNSLFDGKKNNIEKYLCTSWKN